MTEKEKPVEEQIKEFFKSKVKVQKIFTIGSDRVGLIFNPNGQAWQGDMLFIGNPVEEQLKEFFKSEEKTQKIFHIGKDKVGIIFNPNGGAITEGNLQVGDSIVLISEKAISEESEKKIQGLLPEKHSKYSTLTFGQYNGQSPFKAFGLE